MERFYEEQDYRDILDLDRPRSRRSPMSAGNRAKIFAPFAALHGYEEAVDSKNVRRVNKPLLSDFARGEIDRVLRSLEPGMGLRLVRFRQDPGPDGMGGLAEGKVETLEGILVRLDPIYKNLVLRSPETGACTEMDFSDILSLCMR